METLELKKQSINKLAANAAFIEQELKWFSEVVNTRLKIYFNHDSIFSSIEEIPAPEIEGTQSLYENFIESYKLNRMDRICLMLSFVPLLKPQLFDCFNIKNANTDQRFTEFGCIRGNHHNGLIPTFETLLFIIAGDNISERLNYINYFHHHFLFKKRMLNFELISENEPQHSAIITPSVDLIATLIKSGKYSPEFSMRFPARKITTEQRWDELVLDDTIFSQINEIKTWIELGDKMLDEWNLRRKMKPGYRSLFYGPSGSGKTFTATLLGKYTNRDVYCVDLSMVVSKYIGETEKNLSKIFESAEDKNWILFFDEADALFGKRTNIKDSHDRYANQEVSYLLQRVEDYNGLVVLSTNLKTNIDDAFARRFQSVIQFTIPNAEQRERLWKNTFSERTVFAKDVNLTEIAEKYEVTGGAILNIVRYCSLMAMSRNNNIILSSDIINGIRKEFHKEGKTI
ncbi:MAG TPA: ATP-binding protein [Bacteroidales bacterium]|nr:ATP-binding protein [Bacteroidales bacterium]HPS17450.1 ATP-binding protein [Bacteroidales bacterium]